jgi:hypothetical protein
MNLRIRMKAPALSCNALPICVSGVWQLEQSFFQNPKFRAGDYPAGLSYAIEKGWLAKDADWIILTETGCRDLPKELW